MARMVRERAPHGAVLAAFLALAGCFLPPPPPPAPPPPERFCPLRVEDGRVLVQGRLPGERVGWFLFDTGSGRFSLVDKSLSRQLELRHQVVEDKELRFLHVRAELPFVEVGVLGRREVEVFVDDFSSLEHLSTVSAVGVLGTGFFQDACVLIDPARERMSTNHPRVLEPGAVVIELRWGQEGTLLCEGRLDGAPCRILIDTGARRSLVSPAYTFRRGMRTRLVEDQGSAAGAPIEVVEHVNLGLGELEQSLASLPVGRREVDVPGADVLLGMDVLLGYRMIFDFGPFPRLVLEPRAEGGEAGPVDSKLSTWVRAAEEGRT